MPAINQPKKRVFWLMTKRAIQRMKGIIPSLIGSHTPERADFASDMLFARQGYIRILADAKRPEDIREADRAPYQECGRVPNWGAQLGKAALEIENRLEKKQPVRFLEIGPGQGVHLRELVREQSQVEVHSISPEHVNPRKFLKRIGDDRVESVPNSAHEKNWRHHVGMLETYDARKLGKFDVIWSKLASPYYGRYKLEVIQKIAGLLHAGGKAFVEVGFRSKPGFMWGPSGLVPISQEIIAETLGPDFETSLQHQTLTITRKK